jgi:hypothetical protein
MSKNPLPPHPKVISTRKALAKRPQPSLEQVLHQAEASRKFRFSSSTLRMAQNSTVEF